MSASNPLFTNVKALEVRKIILGLIFRIQIENTADEILK